LLRVRQGGAQVNFLQGGVQELGVTCLPDRGTSSEKKKPSAEAEGSPSWFWASVAISS